MPQLNKEEAEDQLRSQNVNPRAMFRERLMDRFAAHEWVRVINLDDEDYYWQYMPSHAETFEFTPDPMKVTHREPAEVWVLSPGKSEVILGENAYIMIEGLYKKLVAKGYMKKNGPAAERNPGRNFNWSDARQQEDLIDKIYLGKESPEFGRKQGAATKTYQVPETPRVATAPGRLTPTQ